ncbi:MAG: ChaN family lipoprotein [Candidatus Cloacimonetes bacterium]|nr:ChaN family lipoprotein [Candidatus Cloacimonadota bacterium]
MKKILFLMVALLNIYLIFANEYKFYDLENKSFLSVEDLVTAVDSFDVIFFGEYHGNSSIHKAEIDFLLRFYNINPTLTVSMEMFERDVQFVLNEYIDNSISEDQFLKDSRPWDNYLSDYRSIIEFSRNKKLPVIAANVPRRYAAIVSRGGIEALEQIPAEEKKYLAQQTKILEDEYKSTFMETMKSNMHSGGMHNSDIDFDSYYAAQCLKDDTMAESIHSYIVANPHRKVIHFNGDFHSRNHLGTAKKLKLLNNEYNIAVISPFIVESDDFEGLDGTKLINEKSNYLLIINQK